jgi:signal transduction histidine kinase
VDVDQLGPRSLRRLLDAVLAIGSDLDLEHVLRRIVEASVALVDARYGAIGVLDEDRTSLATFITVGIDDETRRRIGPPPKGLGLLRVDPDHAHPYRAPVIAEDPASAGFPPGHPPMTSYLGVPIVSRGQVFGRLYLTDKVDAESFSDLDEQLVCGLAAAAGVVIANAELLGRAQRRDATLSAVHAIVAELATADSDHEAMQLLADRALHLANADLATVALPRESGILVLDVVAGPMAPELHGQRFTVSGSVSGEVVRTGRPIVMTDAAEDSRVAQPQVHSGVIGPAVWAPLRANGAPAGTLSVARHRGAPTFTETEIDLILLFAAHAGLILEVDQSRRDSARMSVLHDQERIARDLHDSVIQRLFGIGLSLQATAGLVDGRDGGRINDAIDGLDATIRQIRSVIIGLDRPQTGPDESLRVRLLDVCAEAARALGFDPIVRFDGPIDAAVSRDEAADVIAVVREALSNVARHAGATETTVDLSARHGWVTATITDNGRGPDLAAQRGGHGVANMAARAGHRDGDVVIEAAPSGGTVVRWRIPLTD